MNVARSLSIAVLLFACCSCRAIASPVRLTVGDWVISADSGTETFAVEAGNLGTLLQAGRLWIHLSLIHI